MSFTFVLSAFSSFPPFSSSLLSPRYISPNSPSLLSWPIYIYSALLLVQVSQQSVSPCIIPAISCYLLMQVHIYVLVKALTTTKQQQQQQQLACKGFWLQWLGLLFFVRLQLIAYVYSFHYAVILRTTKTQCVFLWIFPPVSLCNVYPELHRAEVFSFKTE